MGETVADSASLIQKGNRKRFYTWDKTMGKEIEGQAEPCRIVVDKLTGFLTISFVDLRFIQIELELLTTQHFKENGMAYKIE